MAKARYKRKKPRTTGRMSITPSAYWTEEGARNANEFQNEWDERIVRGRFLVCLEAAEIMRSKIRALAPEINGERYAQDLEVVVVEGAEMDEAVAVVYPQQARTLEGEQEDENTALFVSSKKRSPPYVGVLARNSPWTPGLLPTSLSSREATVVSRRVSQGEIQRITSRIMRNRSSIERQLRTSGLRGAKITQDSESSNGTEVVDDLAYSVLRLEFGIKASAHPHWRPGLKEIESSLQSLGKKFITYVQTGKESVFSIPRHGSVTAADLDAIQDFQDTIARAAGL